MTVRSVLVVVAAIAAMLVMSLVFPVLANPRALLLVPSVVLGLSLVKNRRTTVGLAVAAGIAMTILAVALSQPRYVTPG